jgi:uncharacterized protein DUF4224
MKRAAGHALRAELRDSTETAISQNRMDGVRQEGRCRDQSPRRPNDAFNRRNRNTVRSGERPADASPTENTHVQKKTALTCENAQSPKTECPDAEQLKAIYYALVDHLRAVVAGACIFGPKVQKRTIRRADDIMWDLRKALKLQLVAAEERRKSALEALTGCIRASAQIGWLRKHEWHFAVNNFGEPVVIEAEFIRHKIGDPRVAPIQADPPAHRQKATSK